MGSIRKHSQTGLLFFDFRFQGKRCREYTALKDSTANRKQLQKLLDRIDAEMVEGSFEYRRYFRNSKNASKFDVASVSVPTPAVIEARTGPPTPLFSDFAEVWYQEKEVEWRRSHKATIRNELDRSLIPEFGDRG